MRFDFDKREMENQNVSLYDPSTDTLVEITLSKTDATRAQNDIEFATALLNAAVQEQRRQEESSNAAVTAAGTAGTSADIAHVDNPDEDSPQVDEGGSLYRWSTECVLLLLQEYKSMEPKFLSAKYSHKSCWVEISSNLKKHGHSITGPQCAAKLRSLKKTYKSVKDHNNKSGNDRKTWQFFELMEDIFAKKAWCAPVAVASSTAATAGSSVTGDDTDSQGSDSGCPAGPSTSKTLASSKSPASSLLLRRIHQKEEHEKAKHKRHEERMEMDRKLMEVLQQLVNKK